MSIGIKYKNEIYNEIKVSKSFKDSSLMNNLYKKFKNENIDTLFYSKENKLYFDICFTYSNNSCDILLEDRYEIFHKNTIVNSVKIIVMLLILIFQILELNVFVQI